MMDSQDIHFYKYRFSSEIQAHSVGHNKKGELKYNVLFLPEDVINALPLAQYPRLRVDGEMHDIPFEAALHPSMGKWYLLVSRAFMREHDLHLGDSVEVQFNIDDQDRVTVPSALQEALSQNERVLELWNTLTPGRRRGYAAQVAAAKREETRQKRAQKMIRYLLDNKNAGGRPL